jgi:hypothetical protein
MPTITMLRSGKIPVSWRSGVLITGQSALQRTPMTRTLPSASGIESNAPGTNRRREMARATSISGEMITSIGM